MKQIIVKCYSEYSFDKDHFEVKFESSFVPRTGEFIDYGDRYFQVLSVCYDIISCEVVVKVKEVS